MESIKTTEETFNGTYIATSIIKSVKNFENSDALTRKFIVILTDGETTENKFWDYDEEDAIDAANKKGISIIVVGLGNEVKTEYLQKIAKETGGQYIFANNADALESVESAIEASLNYNYVDTDNDGDNDRILIADSGFSPEKDGLPFANPRILYYYDNKALGAGECFGMATFAQLYYKGKLPLTVEEVERHDGAEGLLVTQYIESLGASLKDIEFFKGESNTMAKTTENLASLIVHQAYMEAMTLPSEKVYVRSEENPERLVYNEKYRTIFENSPLFHIGSLNCGENAYWEKGGKKYTKTDYVLFDFNVEFESLTKEEQDAYNIMMTIHNYWARQGSKQLNMYKYNFNTCIIGDMESLDESFNRLIADLNSGIVPIVNGHSHAVNAIALYRDIENPGEYVLEIYDSNHPGETKEVRIERISTDTYFSLTYQDNTNKHVYKLYDTDGTWGEKGKCLGSLSFSVSKTIID